MRTNRNCMRDAVSMRFRDLEAFSVFCKGETHVLDFYLDSQTQSVASQHAQELASPSLQQRVYGGGRRPGSTNGHSLLRLDRRARGVFKNLLHRGRACHQEEGVRGSAGVASASNSQGSST